MFDASIPPAQAYPGCVAVAGYIGGNTPHIWTIPEWQRFGALVQFPIWVGAGRSDGAYDGQAAAGAMHAHGWNPGSPNRRGCVLDMEGQVNPGYVDEFGVSIWQAGYQTFIYEDLAALGGNPAKEGIWLALWDGLADIPAYAAVLAHQYLPNVAWQGTTVDLSTITDNMLAHGGIGARK
jgi:hypothetical protein